MLIEYYDSVWYISGSFEIQSAIHMNLGIINKMKELIKKQITATAPPSIANARDEGVERRCKQI